MWYELLQSRRAKLWLLVIIATMGAAGIFLGMKMAYIQRNEVDPNSNQIKVLNVLKDKGLKKGYAEYWDAGILTFFSNNRAVVLPVACSDSGIVLRRWLMDEALIDVETDRSFILYRKPPVRGSGCKIEDKLAKLGSPVEIIDIGSGYNISIYDRDLFPGAKRN